ncbi:MAG: hypothetical protein KatS3mg082_3089 [Nitrospiraceae bacterium]|nr:MAG: hypothetical protein KatS3mg082_3089 [Nitrospiraceae bacterium]
MSLLARVQRGRTPKPPRILVYGTEGIGKAQPLTAKVLTPTGFVEMGQLRVGDQVIGSDGRPCLILGVYPQGVKEVFRVTFRDGSTTECCDDHLWFTTTESERARGFGGGGADAARHPQVAPLWDTLRSRCAPRPGDCV